MLLPAGALELDWGEASPFEITEEKKGGGSGCDGVGVESVDSAMWNLSFFFYSLADDYFIL